MYPLPPRKGEGKKKKGNLTFYQVLSGGTAKQAWLRWGEEGAALFACAEKRRENKASSCSDYGIGKGRKEGSAERGHARTVIGKRKGGRRRRNRHFVSSQRKEKEKDFL